jgi:hypothetical protein
VRTVTIEEDIGPATIIIGDRDNGGTAFDVLSGTTNLNTNTHTEIFQCVAVSPPAPIKLTIPSVNGGVNPTVGVGFSVVVQAQDGSSTPRIVAANTAVTLSLLTGTGALGGNPGCTIPTGSNTCTVTGVTYSVAEGGVSLTATRTSGDVLAAGNSAAFAVDAAMGSAAAIPTLSEWGKILLGLSLLALGAWRLGQGPGLPARAP